MSRPRTPSACCEGPFPASGGVGASTSRFRFRVRRRPVPEGRGGRRHAGDPIPPPACSGQILCARTEMRASQGVRDSVGPFSSVPSGTRAACGSALNLSTSFTGRRLDPSGLRRRFLLGLTFGREAQASSSNSSGADQLSVIAVEGIGWSICSRMPRSSSSTARSNPAFLTAASTRAR
jgi:hypothetical protein